MENKDSIMLQYLFSSVVRFMVRFELHRLEQSVQSNKDCNTAYKQLIDAVDIVAEYLR